MDISNPLDALITSRTTQALLAATVLLPERRWYLSDLARHLGRRPSSLQEPLAALVAADILSRERDGNRVYFRANPDCPLLPELQGLLAKTVGLVGVLHNALDPLRDRLDVAFVHGSVVEARLRAASDIDLIAVGAAGLADLVPALEKAEQRLKRPVNARVYTREEFAGKLAAKNHFLCSVLEKKKLFVIGTPSDLERIARRRPRRAPQDKPARA
jgi:uncharacterized protein